MSGTKVKVAVRVRPMNKREHDMNAKEVVDMEGNQTLLKSFEHKRARTFAFDHCFWSMDPSNPKFSDQVYVYDCLGKDILENAFEGYNACIFAYGQTGSGKSYTMMGTPHSETQKGIIPRLCDALFERMAKNSDPQLMQKVEVSYMEIYCEKVRDLLCPKGAKQSLKVREHQTLGPYVEGLLKLAVTSFSDIDELMTEGNKARTVAATQMNAESSRSHAVFSITLTQTIFDPASQLGGEKVSKISLVDLAGSERAGKSGALGDRLKEGSQINKSLTTLGLVISALADISAGKKLKNSYIPYRDSTLTWMLKDNLGGNSKTVMVATVSPASDNYEESLSTLRYADRAKRIVNHAVVNEDPNARMIRELREEVEKLRQLLAGQGLGMGDTTLSSLANAKEIAELQEKLKINEDFLKDMSKTWEQKLAETERIHKERQKALEDMGISVQASGFGVQSDRHYLVNLNADPSMNELLVCYLKERTLIGRPNPENPPAIQLQGLGIHTDHCMVEMGSDGIFIKSEQSARTLVNGQNITERTQLKHGDRILLGNNHLFRLSCPRLPGQAREENETQMDYDSAMKEVLMNDANGELLKSLHLKHAEEKEVALEKQKEEYEKQLALLKEQLADDRVSGAPSPVPQATLSPPRDEEEELAWEDRRNQEMLLQSFVRANRLVQEANMLSEELKRDTFFKVTLQIPPKYLRLKSFGESRNRGNDEIVVRVFNKYKASNVVWSLDQLEEKVVAMQELYNMYEEGDSGIGLDDVVDPLVDFEQHALIGVANLFLDCLHQDVRHEYDTPIIAPTGSVCGRLKLAIQKVPLVEEQEQDGSEGEAPTQKDQLSAPSRATSSSTVTELRLGTKASIVLEVIEATGLPSALCHYAFCNYMFFGQSGPVVVPEVVSVEPTARTLAETSPKFHHVKKLVVDVTEEFLEWVESGSLAVEVWGHQRGGFENETIPDEEKKTKTFVERWNDITRRMIMWVEIMELNDQGQYMPVPLRDQADVRTGGIYQLKQGQSRRIHIQLQMKDGGSPLQCDHISSVAIGSIYLRSRYEEPLDTWQDHDLDRLRNKWSDALVNRREYLDSEVHKLISKKERSQVDTERHEDLVDQWTLMQWERSAVLNPRPGSGVPGAPTKWDLELGVEERVPTLFLDLNDDLLTPNDEDPVAAVTTGHLLGEKDERMIDLKILKGEPHEPTAVVSWDSSVHDNTSLNVITGNNERVYAILKVKVVLKHPPGVVLVVRKRICLRIQKKPSGLASFMRKFTMKETRTRCGVMYEVVTGIPKLEGMERPRTKGKEHSYVELEKDENVVEKYTRAMESIANVLQLDQLKQEVALKEKLARAGKVLRKKYAIASTTSPMNTPTSLSRADSGTISNAALTASEPELSERSPSDKGGEDGSGSDSGDPERTLQAATELGSREGESLEETAAAVVEGDPERTLHAVAELDRREGGSVEQDREGTEETAASMGEEGGHESRSSPSHKVGNDVRLEDTTEVEDPLAIVGGPGCSEEKSVTLTRENGSQNQDATENGIGNLDDDSLQSDPDVEHQAEAISKNGNGTADASGNGSRNPDAEIDLKEVSKVCTKAEQSHKPEQGTELKETSTVPLPTKTDDDSRTQLPTQHCDTEDTVDEEGAPTDKEASLSPSCVNLEPPEATEELGETPATADVEQEEEKDEDVKATVSSVLDEGESVSDKSERASSPSEVGTQLITAQSTETLQSSSSPKELPQSSSPPKELPQSSSPPKELPQSSSPPKDLPQSSSPLKDLPQSSSPPSETPQTTSPPKETARSSSPPKETARSSSPPKEMPASTSPPKETAQSSSPPKEMPPSTSPPKETAQSTALAPLPEDTPVTISPPIQTPAGASMPKNAERSNSSSQATPLPESKGSNTATAEVKGAEEGREEPPCPEVGERVLVETAGSFKMGLVKYVGETQFQPGLWIGIALERPMGKHNGTVQGVKYFKCKEGHGMFVRPEKLVRDPTASPSHSPRLSNERSRRPMSGGATSNVKRSASGRSSLETRRVSSGVGRSYSGKKS